jgi:hypothetical protein
MRMLERWRTFLAASQDAAEGIGRRSKMLDSLMLPNIREEGSEQNDIEMLNDKWSNQSDDHDRIVNNLFHV